MYEIHFLVLDDNEEIQQKLVEALLAEVPEAEIDRASNLADAIDAARRLADDGKAYHLALLDAKLPGFAGDDTPPALHAGKRKELLSLLSHSTVVVNYSSFATSSDVRQCVLDELRDPNGPVPVLLDTNGPWLKEVRRILRQRVFVRGIEDDLNQLLRGMKARRGVPVPPPAAVRGGSARSFDVSGLAYSIGQFWYDLDERQQALARKVFSVRIEDDGVYVRL